MSPAVPQGAQSHPKPCPTSPSGCTSHILTQHPAKHITKVSASLCSAHTTVALLSLQVCPQGHHWERQWIWGGKPESCWYHRWGVLSCLRRNSDHQHGTPVGPSPALLLPSLLLAFMVTLGGIKGCNKQPGATQLCRPLQSIILLVLTECAAALSLQ